MFTTAAVVHKVTDSTAPRAKLGTIKNAKCNGRPYPIRLGIDSLDHLDTIRRALMSESPRKPISMAASVRRALAHYAVYLNRIGAEKLSREVERAAHPTYANPQCYVTR